MGVQLSQNHPLGSINIQKITKLKTISHNCQISFLLRLNDGRIAAACLYPKILIYNASTLKTDMVIEGHGNAVKSLCQLPNGNLISCSYDKRIKIWLLLSKTYQCLFTIYDTYELKHIVLLSENRLASMYKEKGVIKIWKITEPYKDDHPIKEMFYQGKSIVNYIYYVKNKDMLISGGDNCTLYTWNLKTYQSVTNIKTKYIMLKCVREIDSDRIIIGGYLRIIIVNLKTLLLEKEFFFDNTEFFHIEMINSMIILRDGKSVLCGCSYGYLMLFDIETKKYDIFKTEHTKIVDMINVNNYVIATCAEDKTIKLWKY